MKTVHEISKLTGVSVRTLHHYDAIGLFKPSKVTDAGYRLYDDTALERLQTILLFRELQFPLKKIKSIIENPNFDRKQALTQQIGLLELQRKRLGELIDFAREIITTGVNTMDFSAFDKTEIEQYAAEAQAKWGNTDAYKECEQKAANKTDAEQKTDSDGLMEIFTQMGQIKHLSPDCSKAQEMAEILRSFITEHYYNCTPQIFRGLGELYVGDERFKANIDAAGGTGTAEFASRAIQVYCDNQSV